MSTIGTKVCPACEYPQAEVREAKAGGLTTYCPDCKYQGFAKSPKAAAAQRASLGGSQQQQPTKEDKDDGNWLRKL